MRNDFFLHEIDEARIQPGLFLVPFRADSNRSVLPSEAFHRKGIDRVNAVLHPEVFPVPTEQEPYDMRLVLAIPDFFLRLFVALHRSYEVRILSKPVKVAELILKHVILSLLARHDIALTDLHCQVSERCEDGNGSEKLGDCAQSVPVHLDLPMWPEPDVCAALSPAGVSLTEFMPLPGFCGESRSAERPTAASAGWRSEYIWRCPACSRSRRAERSR